MHTPWGQAYDIHEIADGIMKVTTDSHGGLKLDRKRNAMVPEYMRRPSGWYEEDCEWSIVGVVFPALFAHMSPMKTFKNWYPDHYERFTGLTLKEGESFRRDEKLFEERNKNNLVVRSAFSGSYFGEPVPDGFVLVFASISRAWSGRKFLVPAEEYDKRGRFGFVVEPERHKEL